MLTVPTQLDLGINKSPFHLLNRIQQGNWIFSPIAHLTNSFFFTTPHPHNSKTVPYLNAFASINAMKLKLLVPALVTLLPP